MIRTIRPLVLALALSLAAAAHDLYLLPEGFFHPAGSSLTLAVHNGDGFPQGEDAPSPSRFNSPTIRSLTDQAAIGDFEPAGNRTLGRTTLPPGPGPYVISLSTQPRFIELSPGKFDAYLAHEGLEAVRDFRRSNGELTRHGREIYSKYAKSIVCGLEPSPNPAPEAGLRVEFLPLTPLCGVEPGAKLRFRLVLNGKPLKKQPVSADIARDARTSGRHWMVGQTDEEGAIEVTARRGIWRLHTVVMERRTAAEALKREGKPIDRLDGNDSDWESFWASLTFEIR